MTVRHAIEIDIALFLFAGVVFGFGIATYSNKVQKTHTFISMPQIQNIQTMNLSPTIIPEKAFRSKIETFSQISPDGTKKLTMTVASNKDLTSTYSFVTSDENDANQLSIYSVKLPITESMSIPFNSWSPDNVYFFIEKSSSEGKSALVMRADGQPLTVGEQVQDVTEIFAVKSTGDSYKETTGWASETLLIVNSTSKDLSNGPSYWFEVPSKAVIQLSTGFY